MVKTEKRKVKLVFSKLSQMSEMSDTFRHDIEVDVPEDWGEISLLAASVKNSYDRAVHLDGNEVSSQEYNVIPNIWSHKNEETLVGKVLTILDSAIEDKDRREATKSLARELIYGHMRNVRRSNERIIEANEREQKAQPKLK